MKEEYCEYCDDGTGKSVFPYYGVAPHNCFYKIGKQIGQSEMLPEAEFPENFVMDGEWDEHATCGVYTHCLNCGAGEKNDDEEIKAGKRLEVKSDS